MNNTFKSFTKFARKLVASGFAAKLFFAAILVSFCWTSSATIAFAQKIKRPAQKPPVAAKKFNTAQKSFDEAVELFGRNDPQSWNAALAKFDEARLMFQTSANKRGEADAITMLGNTYRKLGNAPKTIENYEKAIVIYRILKDREGEASALNNIAALYRDVGRFDDAVRFYEQTLPLMRQTRNKDGEAFGKMSAINSRSLIV